VYRVLPILFVFFPVSVITDLVAYVVLSRCSPDAYSHYYLAYTFSGAMAELLVCWETLEVMFCDVGLERWLHTKAVIVGRAGILLLIFTSVIASFEYADSPVSEAVFAHIDGLFAVIESIAFVSLCLLCSVLQIKRGELIRQISYLFGISSLATLSVHILNEMTRITNVGSPLQRHIDLGRSIFSCILLCCFTWRLKSQAIVHAPRMAWFRFSLTEETHQG